MLPEVGATELLVVAAVALIVVGPKDLPILMRKLGQWIAKMRGLASEFRSSFDELARQSELDELRKEVDALRNTRLPDPLSNLQPTFDEVSAGLDPHGFSIADQSYPPTTVEPTPAPEPAPEPSAAKPRARKPKADAAPAPSKPRAKSAAAKPAAAKTATAKPRTPARAKRGGSVEA